MLTIAYSQMGLTIEEFFGLSWYEWGLECLKLKAKNKKAFEVWEGHAFLMRRFMTLFANANRDDKKQPQPYKDTDWGIALSFDKPEETVKEVRELTPEEIEAKFGKFLRK